MMSIALPTVGTHGAVTQSVERVFVHAIESRESLQRFLPDLEDLASSAVEPNVFYEPWMLMPAIESYGSGRKLIFVLVFTATSHANGPPVLTGFFPLERTERYKGLPFSALSLWKYIHCYLCTPLLREGREGRTLEAFFIWLRENCPDAPLMEFGLVSADGRFGELLGSTLATHTTANFVYGRFTRAFLQRGQESESYLKRALSGRARKELRRVQRRLDELGRVEYALLEPDDDPDAWLCDFLELEAGGWKGRARSAMACNEPDRTFFRAIMVEAFSRQRLMMLALRLDGRPIAEKCNLLAGDGVFAFKIAFDEAYRRFSPGVLLEVENIRRLHESQPGRWMDTCAVSDHIMANRLFADRRAIQSVLITNGRPLGDLLIGAMPMLRWISRRIPRRSASSEPRHS